MIYALKVIIFYLVRCKMRLFNFFSGKNVLYFQGCDYKKYSEGYELYKKIFSKLGIKFISSDDVGIGNMSCGLDAWETGHESETRKIVRRNFEILRENGFEEIITTSPECYKMFLQNYPEIIPDWNINVENIWTLLLDRILKRHSLIKDKLMEVVTFHDNCYLGNYCDIYEEPRKILELIGFEIKEMDNSREDSFCCGSCGGLVFTNPDLANKIAKERILQAKRIGIKKMIVIGFKNYDLLKKNIGDSKVEIFELSEVLAHALGIKRLDEKAISEEPIEGEEKVLTEEKGGEES